MSPIAAGDLLLVQRGSTQYKAATGAAGPLANAQPTDLFLVQRAGTQYRVPYSVLNTVQDADLVLVQRGATQYKATGAELKAWLVTPPAGDPWTPADLGLRLEGWYDAAGPLVTVIGVSQWTDKSGKGNHFEQSSASLQPTVGTFAGRPAVMFADGVGDFMTSALAFPGKVAIVSCMGYPSNDVAPPFVWSVTESAELQRRMELHLNRNGSIRAIQRDVGPFVDIPAGTGQSFYDDCTIAGAYGSTADPELRAHLNGLAAAMTVSPDQAPGALRLRLAMRGNNTFPSAARFSEIICISDWTVADIEKIEGYLAWRYGGLPLSRLIANHPHKNAPPTK